MDAELRNMVMAFRVTELQNLLGHFGKNKNGRKNELQARALELVKVRDAAVVTKIRELYRSIQLSLNQPLPASAVVTHNTQQFTANSTMGGRLFGNPVINAGSDKPMYQTRTIYANNYNGSQQIPGLQIINNSSRLPICPDVRMKRLPFYDILAELTRPTSLLSSSNARVQEANFTFCLTPCQAAEIASSKEYNASNFSEHKIQYSTQVQMRFGALDIASLQDDLFPPSITVKVNQRNVPLPHPIPSNRPGIEAKRPSRPLNVTNYVKVSPTVTNYVNVSWANDMTGRDYVISITLVKKLCSQDLLARLKGRGPRPAEYTKGMIKELVRKDDADCIATTSFKVSIACPLGKCRMTLPCRASTCKHLQCFDANLYLQMNEKKPVWSCPVCDKFTAFDDLAIDGYFGEVIAKLVSNENDGNDIEVLPDGTWKHTQPKKEPDEPPPKKIKQSKDAEETICLDDDDVSVIFDDPVSVKAKPSSSGSKEASKPPSEVIDLTFTSDEEEEEPKKVTKKRKSRRTSSIKSSSSNKSPESDDEPIKLRLRRKKPAFLIEESSSSSTDTETTHSPPDTPTAPTSTGPPRSRTPDCITLDSPTPSPESGPETEPESRKPSKKSSNTTDDTNTVSNATTTFSASGYNSTDPLIAPYNPITFGGALGNVGPPLSNVLPPTTESFPPINPFMPFDRPTWDNTSSFPPTSDFSSLDYPSMDYFNQGSSSFASGSTSRPGGAGGIGYGMGGRW